MDRKPNELLVSRELLEQLFGAGKPRTWSVPRGPAPEARIIGVQLAGDVIVLQYDRPIDEVVAMAHHPLREPVDPPSHEIRKGGIGHNEVIPRHVVMTPDGLAIVPTDEEVLDAVLGPRDHGLTDQTLG